MLRLWRFCCGRLIYDSHVVLCRLRSRYLGTHPNIVSLEDLFVSEHYDELYIVMELLDSDLHRIIQSPQALGDAHHRYFMFQLLKGVKVRWRRLVLWWLK